MVLMRAQINFGGTIELGQAWCTRILLPWSALTLIFVCVGVPFHTSTLVSAAVLALCFAGIAVISWALPETELSNLMMLGPGFVIGILLWVVPTQLLGSGAPTNAMIFCLLVAFVCISCCRNHSKFLAYERSGDAGVRELVTTTGLALMMISGEWPSFAIAGIVIISSGFVTKQVPNSKFRLPSWISSLAISMTVLVWSARRLKTYGWLVTDDYSYLEALRIHLAEFGIWQRFGPSNVAIYYWISPAWVGQMSQITFADDWLVLTRVATLMFSISCAATTICLVGQLSRVPARVVASSAAALLIVYVFVATGIDYSGTSTFSVFAIASASILVTLRAAESRFPKRTWVIVGLMILGTVFSKLMAAPIVASLGGLIVVIYYASQSRLLTPKVMSAVCILCGLYVFFLDRLGQLLGSDQSPPWTIEFRVIESPDQLLRDLAPHMFQIVLPLTLVVLVWGLETHSRKDGLPLVAIAVTSFLFFLLSTLLIVPGYASDVDNYFARPANFFALVAIISFVIPFGRRSAVVAGLSASASLSFSPDIGLSLQPLAKIVPYVETIINSVTAKKLVIPVFFGIAISLAWAIKTTRETTRSPRLHLLATLRLVLLTVALTISVQVLTSRVVQEFSRGSDRWSSRETDFVVSVMGDSELESVGRWLRLHSQESSVIATNDLCETERGKEPYGETFDCDHMGTDHTLARTSHRRFLVLGPRFHYQDRERTSMYVRASLKFGETLADIDRDTLRRLGVRYFINCYSCRRAVANEKLWPPHGLVVAFENYAIIDLDHKQPTPKPGPSLPQS